MLELLLDPHAWAALATLTALEIVLGIDNVVFISLLVARLDKARAERARRIGLALALIFRVALLFGLTGLMHLRAPLFSLLGNTISWRDIILVGGGLFLVAKAVHEIHREVDAVQAGRDAVGAAAAKGAFGAIVVQIAVIDMVFSIDSIITAIGLVDDIPIMVAAILIAVAVMYVASGPASAFIARHPTTKVLALAFLVLIGVALIADGFDVHIPRGYVYFAMAFAGAVETVNILARDRRRRARKRKD
ncbi:MAG: TerC family protein [Proteobacteria bacterium]|nr:TerC family protein [Pseudomonadota bacterium]